MSKANGSLVFDTHLDGSGFNKGTKQLSNGLSSVLGKFGKVLASAYLLKKAFDFGKEAINIASDLEEVQNVVDTAFGDMAYKCEKFADESIRQFGMSRLAAKKTASTYMAMGKSMGLTMDAASDMAVEMAKLTGDVASFYNISQDLASIKLKGVWTGETEALKDIGVVMTEANLQQFALTQGMKKQYSAMTQAEKVALRYAYVTSVLADASGDFARTQDSWANQTRILSESWKELLGTIGNGLLQVLTPIVKALNVVIQKLIDFANVFSSVIAKVFNKQAEQQKIVAKSSEQAAVGENKLANATKKAGKEAQKSVSGFDELNILTNQVAENADNMSDSLASVGSGGGVEVKTEVVSSNEMGEVEVPEWMKKLQEINFTPFIESLGRLKEAFAPFGIQIFNGLKWGYDNIFVPLAKFTIEEVLPRFFDTLANSLRIITAVLDALKPTFEWFWENVLKPIASFTADVFLTTWDLINEALGKFATWCSDNEPMVQGITETIGGFFLAWKVTELFAFIQMSGGIAGAFTKIGAAIWACTGAKIADKAETMILTGMYAKDFVVSVAKGTAALLEQAGQWVLTTGAKIADTAATTAATAATWLFNAALAVLTSPITLVIAAITALIAIVVLLIKHWDKVKEVAQAVFDYLMPIFEKVATWFYEHVCAPVIEHVTKLVNSIKEKFTKEYWVDKLNGFKEAFTGMFKNAINGAIELFNKFIGWINSKMRFEWDEIRIAGKTIVPAGSVQLFTIPQLPKLATGTVVPANFGEFQAILGDNKREPEIVSPLSTMKQALKEALVESGVNTAGNNTIVLEIDRREFGRAVVDCGNQETKRRGVLLRSV